MFKPAGTPLQNLEIVKLAHDEMESLYLCDGEGKTQEEAGICMGISRGTVQRLLATARRKVAQALVGQKALAISTNHFVNEEVTVSGQSTKADLPKGAKAISRQAHLVHQ